MTELIRRSPVKFASRPTYTEVCNHWIVVRSYEEEGRGPWLADLCHKSRWDVQDSRLDERNVSGISIPASPGDCRMEKGMLVNRMNRTQAAVWHLTADTLLEMPAESAYTDVTEAALLLALFGPGVFAIAEKLSALDFTGSDRQTPFLLQGPLSHVPSQIAVLSKEGNGTGTLLIACARGYAGDMVDAIMAAGAEHGLSPAGEDRFTNQLASLQN